MTSLIQTAVHKKAGHVIATFERRLISKKRNIMTVLCLLFCFSFLFHSYRQVPCCFFGSIPLSGVGLNIIVNVVKQNR